jgi:hypothetical protein
MKTALFLDTIGRDETFSEHGFLVSGVRREERKNGNPKPLLQK